MFFFTKPYSPTDDRLNMTWSSGPDPEALAICSLTERYTALVAALVKTPDNPLLQEELKSTREQLDKWGVVKR